MHINVENIVKFYGDVRALDGLSMKLFDNEIVGLVGPNGAGKTTILKVLSRLLEADEGTVSYPHEFQDLQNHLAYVPEHPDLFSLLTVEEHFTFMALAYSLKDWEERRDYLLETFQLQEKGKALIGELSKGMRQKVMISITLLREPNILLFDEPFSGLDPHSVRELRTLIAGNRASGKVILVSSHNLESIQRLCQRVLIMDRGKILKEATMEELVVEMEERDFLSLEELFLEVTSHGTG